MKDMIKDYKRDEFTLTADSSKIDLIAVQALLNSTYWAQGRSIETIKKTIEHSLCFSLFDKEKQIGFMRVVTDCAIYAYLCDVVISNEYRGKGLGSWMLKCAFEHDDLQNLKRWSLITKDAHEFYKPFGFKELKDAHKYMEIDNSIKIF